MRKPDILRQALVAAVPELTRDPDRLKIFIDEGSIATRMGKALGFEYRYRCNVELLDYVGAPDAIFFALVLWLREHQPDLLLAHDRANQAIVFEVDLIDSATVDVLIKLQLTEAVTATPREAGGHELVHIDEPQIPTFEPDPPGVLLEELWLRDELILQAQPAP